MPTSPTLTPAPISMPPVNRVGFFNPVGIVPDLVLHTAFGMINAIDTHQVERSLAAAVGTAYRVKIDFSELLLERVPPSSVGQQYRDSSDRIWTKKFAPLARQKLRCFPSDIMIARIMASFIAVMRQYKTNLGTIFLADEPYLNGISKTELERAGAIVRRELDAAGLEHVELGVIFASGMFNAEFAQHLDRASGDYARGIDACYDHGMAVRNGTVHDPLFDSQIFDNWVDSTGQFRLTTYDAAGNMYVGGGLPSGFDVVAFDFYLSTILLDSVHENTLSWFASRSSSACGKFAGQKMSSIRSTLSFIQDGPIRNDEAARIADRQLLDDIFTCRMTGTLDLLRQATQGTSTKMMMISESSANGVMEFHADGRLKEDQPRHVIEERVLDEVVRGLNFYNMHRSDFASGLMFFIFDDAHDYSINLDICGARSLPSVTKQIYAFAQG